MSRSTFAFLVALVAGLGLGLVVGWVLSPVQYTDTDPPSLRQDYRDDYVLMIATDYAREDDLVLARARLAGLGFSDPGPAVALAGARLALASAPEADLRRLARLAAALQSVPPELQTYLP